MVLLDSCSTVNLFCDTQRVSNIRHVHPGLRIHCNAGYRTATLKAQFGSFPEEVWYDPDGAANVLSLHTVRKYYRVSYDSQHGDTFVIHTGKGTELYFRLTTKGLYAFAGSNDNSGLAMAFITTAKAIRQNYTTQEYNRALLA